MLEQYFFKPDTVDQVRKDRRNNRPICVAVGVLV